MTKVKKQVNLNNELVGYLVDDELYVQISEGNRHYQDVLNYIKDGGMLEEAYTQDELLVNNQNVFRAERNRLISLADIEINKLDDVGVDSTTWRNYRQALRDATNNWVLPNVPL